MTDFPKPALGVSKCITFQPVRRDSRIIASEFVKKLKPYLNFVPVCHEAGIGLSVPREPVRMALVNEPYLMMQTFFELYLEELAETNVLGTEVEEKDYWKYTSTGKKG